MTGHHPNPTLADLAVGETAVVQDFNLPAHVAERLMNLGLIPGLKVVLAHIAPGGTPRVYRVDGAEFALRNEVTKHIAIRPLLTAEFGD